MKTTSTITTTSAKASKNARFQRGTGCFKCHWCGKMTRSTGRGDNEHADLCAKCYDASGYENSISDGIEGYTEEGFVAEFGLTTAEFNKLPKLGGWKAALAAHKAGKPAWKVGDKAAYKSAMGAVVKGEIVDLKGGVATIRVPNMHGTVLLSPEQLLPVNAKPSVSATPVAAQSSKGAPMSVKVKTSKAIVPETLTKPGARAAEARANVAARKAAAAPAAKPAKAPKAPKASKAAKPNRKGKTSGLKVAAYWCKLFAENETNKRKWTDAQITAMMKAEFPWSTAKEYDTPWAARRHYNRGWNAAAPKVQSHEYDAKGNVIEHRTRRPGPAAQKPSSKALRQATASVAQQPAAKPDKAVKPAKGGSPVVELGRFQRKVK